MIKNLLTNNNIQQKYLDKNILKKFLKRFDKITKDINNDISNPKKTLNVLNKNFKFNFEIGDLITAISIFQKNIFL